MTSLPAVALAEPKKPFRSTSYFYGFFKGGKHTEMALLDTDAPSRYLRHPVDARYPGRVVAELLHVLHVNFVRDLTQISDAIVRRITVYVVHFSGPRSVVDRPANSMGQVVNHEYPARSATTVAGRGESRAAYPSRVPRAAYSFFGKHAKGADAPAEHSGIWIVIQKLSEGFRAYARSFFHDVLLSRCGWGQQRRKLLAPSYLFAAGE